MVTSVNHTHESLSTIDHFMVTPNLSDFIIKYETLETVKNFSDHILNIMKLNIDIEHLQTVKRTIPPTVAWTKCTKEQLSRYQIEIDKKLDEIELDFDIFACRDSKCEIHGLQPYWVVAPPPEQNATALFGCVIMSH